ncbi:MAG: hypothetical protein M3R24_05735 [Chloroflexota bacterium]|nr:hypothetical protein [Chloroflexota bacterium]
MTSPGSSCRGAGGPTSALRTASADMPFARRGRSHVDGITLKIGTRRHSDSHAMDEHGQIVDGSISDRRNTAATRTCFHLAIDASGVTPTRVTTGCPLGEAKRYPAAVHAVHVGLLVTEPRSSKYMDHRRGRDHQHRVPVGRRPGAPDAALQGVRQYGQLLPRPHLDPQPDRWEFKPHGGGAASAALGERLDGSRDHPLTHAIS